jgi:Mg2+ and Co2+ transporters
MKVLEINDEIREVDIRDVNLNSKFMYWLTMSCEELKANNDIFNFNSLSIYECSDQKQNPKLDFFDDYDFFVLNSIELKNNSIISNELNIFAGRNYIVTVTKNNIGMLKELEGELINYKQNVIFNTDRSVIKILYYILDRIILNDYEIIAKLENMADETEIKILKNADKKYLNELIHIRRQVHKIRNYIAPLRYIGDNLVCNDNMIIGREHMRYFEQINIRIDKLINSIDSLVQYLVLVREAFEAEIANKTNELMKVFTIIAAIFLPLSLITGIFGMNFEGMDVLKTERGFELTILFMVAVSICLFIFFKKKKWL